MSDLKIIHTAEWTFLNFMIEYLRKIGTEFQNVLASLLGDPHMGLIHDKNTKIEAENFATLSIFRKIPENLQTLWFNWLNDNEKICCLYLSSILLASKIQELYSNADY